MRRDTSSKRRPSADSSSAFRVSSFLVYDSVGGLRLGKFARMRFCADQSACLTLSFSQVSGLETHRLYTHVSPRAAHREQAGLAESHLTWWWWWWRRKRHALSFHALERVFSGTAQVARVKEGRAFFCVYSLSASDTLHKKMRSSA